MWLELLSDQSVELLSCVRLFVTPRTAACQASLSITNFWSLLRLMSIESVMPSNHLILSCLLLLSVFPSIRIFSSESALCIKWPKYQFQLQHQSFQWIFRLISFRIDSFDLLAVQILSDECFYKSYHQIMEFGYTVKTQLLTATRRPK